MQADNTNKLLLTLALLAIAASFDQVTVAGNYRIVLAGAAFFSIFCLLFAILQIRFTKMKSVWGLLFLILSACGSIVILADAIRRLCA